MSGKDNIPGSPSVRINYTSSPQVQKALQDTALSGMSSEESIPMKLEAITRERNRLLAEEGQLLEKGLQSMNPDILMKANQHWGDVQQRESSGTKSTVIDPNEFSQSVGYKTKSYSLSYQLLRKMSASPIIRAIITTRQAQVSAFSSPQADRFDTGFLIRKKKEYYTTEEPKLSKADKEEIKRITEFLLNCGDDTNQWHGDNFDKFLKKITEDALSLDQATFEIVRNLKGQPVEFLATDGGTFRIADTYDDDEGGYNHREATEKFGYLPSYVQVINGEVENEYYPWELCFGLRNDSTDIRRNGYGRSELEDLIDIVTYMLYGDAYNGKFFSQGSSPKGLIKISGNVNSNRLQEFKQQWVSMVSGVMNAWKVPVIESDKMEWVDLQKSNNDMQFGAWQEYLIKVSCAVYKISPEEIGFASGAGGGGSSMFEGSNTESRLKYSRDKGLRPLLKNLQFWINKYIVNALNKDFEFVFAGIDTDSRKDELELDVKMVENFGGWKEARRKWGLPDELEEGDFPLNQIFFQKMQADEMAEEQEENTDFVNEEAGQEEDPYAGMWDNLDKSEVVENPMMNDLNSFWKSITVND